MAKVFARSEKDVEPIKTAVEVETDSKTEYLAKLKIDDRNIPDSFKFLMDGWTKIRAWSFAPCFYYYPNIFNYLMFFPSELGLTK